MLAYHLTLLLTFLNLKTYLLSFIEAKFQIFNYNIIFYLKVQKIEILIFYSFLLKQMEITIFSFNHQPNL